MGSLISMGSCDPLGVWRDELTKSELALLSGTDPFYEQRAGDKIFCLRLEPV